jgi:hypothetical protein
MGAALSDSPGFKGLERLERTERDTDWIGLGMDQISIKTPNPICRLYWCLIVFIDWRYSQAVMSGMLVFSTPLVN